MGQVNFVEHIPLAHTENKTCPGVVLSDGRAHAGMALAATCIFDVFCDRQHVGPGRSWIGPLPRLWSGKVLETNKRNADE